MLLLESNLVMFQWFTIGLFSKHTKNVKIWLKHFISSAVFEEMSRYCHSPGVGLGNVAVSCKNFDIF